MPRRALNRALLAYVPEMSESTEMRYEISCTVLIFFYFVIFSSDKGMGVSVAGLLSHYMRLFCTALSAAKKIKAYLMKVRVPIRGT